MNQVIAIETVDEPTKFRNLAQHLGKDALGR